MIDKKIQVNRKGIAFDIMDGEICHLGSWDFWNGEFPAVFEPATMDWIEQYCDKEHDFLDIGAWVGPTTLWASQFARNVMSFEPDKTAYYYLNKNIKLNCENVKAYNQAIATVDRVQMFSRTYPGDSMSNMLGAGNATYEVAGMNLEAAFALGDINLVKMDIEGGEAIVLPANKELLGDMKIPLILSLHGSFYRTNEDFANIINALGAYDHFCDQDNNSISRTDIANGFDVILCS